MNRPESLQKAQNSPPIRLSPAVRTLVAALKTLNAEDPSRSYDELSDLIGMDVRTNARGGHLLDAARKILEVDHNLSFERVNGEGVKLRGPTDLLEHAKRVQKGIGRKAKRTSKRLDNCLDYDELSLEEKMEANAARTTLALAAMLPKKKIQDRLLEAVSIEKTTLQLENELVAIIKAKTD